MKIGGGKSGDDMSGKDTDYENYDKNDGIQAL
jgi:hypothetical protein